MWDPLTSTLFISRQGFATLMERTVTNRSESYTKSYDRVVVHVYGLYPLCSEQLAVLRVLCSRLTQSSLAANPSLYEMPSNLQISFYVCGLSLVTPLWRPYEAESVQLAREAPLPFATALAAEAPRLYGSIRGIQPDIMPQTKRLGFRCVGSGWQEGDLAEIHPCSIC